MDLLTPKEVSNILRVSLSQVYRWLRTGVLTGPDYSPRRVYAKCVYALLNEAVKTQVAQPDELVKTVPPKKQPKPVIGPKNFTLR